MLFCALAVSGWPSMLSCDRELEPGGRKIHWMTPYLDLDTEIVVNDDKRPWLQLRSGEATYLPGETTFNVVCANTLSRMHCLDATLKPLPTCAETARRGRSRGLGLAHAQQRPWHQRPHGRSGQSDLHTGDGV